MLCYKDITFCKFHHACKQGDGCAVALTEQVKEDAKAVGLPICNYTSIPDCMEWRSKSIEKRITDQIKG